MLFAKAVACWLPALGVSLLAYRKGESRAKWVSVMVAYQDSPGKNNPYPYIVGIHRLFSFPMGYKPVVGQGLALGAVKVRH